MITFYDLLAILGAVAGALLGMGFARTYGFSTILGVVAGIIVGGWLGRIPKWMTVRRARKRLARFTIEELRQQLYTPAFSPNRWPPNHLLLELKARGEDLSRHIELVLSMLEADAPWQRAFGYGALLSVYPHLAKDLKGYRPSASVEDCRERVGGLRKQVRSNMSAMNQ
ncbi:MAG: hypothetical protein ABFE01_12670 [Phycisphaerales bacterium]|jgi:hypothetical protein